LLVEVPVVPTEGDIGRIRAAVELRLLKDSGRLAD
jgi:hypothetical protein